MTLCYVGHHDEAYKWAERRKLETHPTTGAAQLVELREIVQEITVPVYAEAETQALPKAQLFSHVPDAQLLGYGVPEEWLDDVRVANEDSVLGLADHLPAEAAEALLELAVGGTSATVPTCPGGRRPLQPPRRPATVPRYEQHRGAGGGPSSTRGNDGPYSCTRTSRGSWKGTTTARQGCPAPLAPARPLSPSTGPPTWPGPTRMRGCC